MIRRYSELIRLPTIEDRYQYLRIAQGVGARTFGADRYINQAFYRSTEWRTFRNGIIIRDNGCDLAVEGYPVGNRGYIHHINPITLDDLSNGASRLMDPENVILCSFNTHNAIHYGNADGIPKPLVERRPNDTCPWR